MGTPHTKRGLKSLDKLPACDAVMLAWMVEGRKPKYHQDAKQQVRELMPVLGRALDRLEEEARHPRFRVGS